MEGLLTAEEVESLRVAIWHSEDAVESAIRGLGYTYVGSGAYARVFLRGDSIVKMLKQGRKDGYYHYAHWVAREGWETRGAEHLPAIHHIIERQDAKIVLVETEALQTIWAHPIRAYHAGMRQRFMPYGREEEGSNIRPIPATLADALANIKQRLPNRHEGAEEGKILFGYDLHEDNWMRRDDTPVVTDPLSTVYA